MHEKTIRAFERRGVWRWRQGSQGKRLGKRFQVRGNFGGPVGGSNYREARRASNPVRLIRRLLRDWITPWSSRIPDNGPQQTIEDSQNHTNDDQLVQRREFDFAFVHGID